MKLQHHNLVDSVRGNTKVLYSSMSNSEDTTSDTDVTSFASDGFALGSGTNTNKNNHNLCSLAMESWNIILPMTQVQQE